jgi:hypothetical protein
VHISPVFDAINDTTVFDGTIWGELPTAGQEYALFCNDLFSLLEATRTGNCDNKERISKRRMFIILCM